MAEIVDFGLQQHKIKMDNSYFDNGLSVVAGDTGRRIEVQLLDTNGMVQNTTGLNLRLNAVVEGKATYTDATLVNATTGKYQLDLSNGMFLAPGDWQFQWQITDSAGKKLHSFAFTGNVGKNISEGGNQATNFYLNLEDLKAMQEDLLNKPVSTSKATSLLKTGRLLSTEQLDIDSINKKVIFPKTGVINFIRGRETFNLSTALLGTEWDLSDRNANYIAFDTPSQTIVSLPNLGSLNENHTFLGYINWGSNFAVDLDANYMVNGVGYKNVKGKKWYKKTLAALGDSITNGDNGEGQTSNTWSWTAHLNRLNGFGVVNNLGKNGSSYAVRSGRTDSMVERYPAITGGDVISVWAGVNDFHAGVPLGSMESENTTDFYGAVKTVLKGVANNHPKAKIFVMTPMKTTKIIDSFSVNSVGLTQKEYVDAIKEVASYLSVPVLDMYAEGNISPYVESHSIFTADKLHPTELGYERISSQIASFIETL